jgi:uncharacterized membrane protein
MRASFTPSFLAATTMHSLLLFLHLAAAIVWLGGMTVMIFAARPAVLAQLHGTDRVQLLAAILQRFFALVWVSIAVILASGLWMYGVGTKAAVAARRASASTDAAQGMLLPLGWNIMLGLGLLMMLLFAHLYFAHFKKLQRAVAAADTAAAAAQLAKIHPLVLVNFALGWVAVAAVKLL